MLGFNGNYADAVDVAKDDIAGTDGDIADFDPDAKVMDLVAR